MKRYTQEAIAAVGANVMTSFASEFPDKKHQKLAKEIQPIIEDYFSVLPIGCNFDTKDDHYTCASVFVKAKYQEIHPIKAFFLPIIFAAILSWLIQKYLDYLWG